MRSYQLQTFLFIFIRRIEFIDMTTIFAFQLVDNFVGAFRILLVQIIRNLDQCICRT
ncbi:unknown [Bacteroides sp. CAG:598]|nr:unknown [Bacteroides sp. CAG:598]